MSKRFRGFTALAAFALISACDHPLEPVGNGDILSSSGTRDCTLEDYQSYSDNCDKNTVENSDYVETYTAVPRPGWRFVRWENYCENAATNECSFNANADAVAAFQGNVASTLRAVFAPNLLDFGTSEPPLDLQNIPASFAENLSYGPKTRNRFDILMPESDEPTPLIIFAHSGSFTAGSRSEGYSIFYQGLIREALSNGIAYATFDYSFVELGNENEGVIKSLNDSERVLQYIRLHADSFNVDKDRIAMFGVSAGSGMSLWNGTKDETADPRHIDPLKRQSTRLKAVGAVEAQATYDIVRWDEIFIDFGISYMDYADNGYLNVILNLYGIDNLAELDTPEIEAYRHNVDMLGALSADDAPFWLQNRFFKYEQPLDFEDYIHHAFHARALRDKANEVGLENITSIPKIGIEDPTGESLQDFLIRKLQE